VDADGFLYFAGENAVYKVHPDTLAVSSTNSFQSLNYLNLLYDGRLIAADINANLYIFERDFDTNPAHKSPVASYTGIGETSTNAMAVDALNKIYVITVSKVWAIQWQGLNLPMVCLWRYSYSTSGQGSGTSVTVAADRVIFADRPLLAPFHYISIPKNQNIPNCGAPTGACLQ
jgi:hypothetical protein